MKWYIPAKTFLLGEYAALSQGSALILTTTPYFECTLIENMPSQGIHPASPAGKLWQHCFQPFGLDWHDPYQSCGGLGASSAQFIGAYLARCFLKDRKAQLVSLLEQYHQYSWSGTGVRPSGYDVLAQTQHGCVYINQKRNTAFCYDWPFVDLDFLLVHTGNKLPTHTHLEDSSFHDEFHDLSAIVDECALALETKNAQVFIRCINQYHERLCALNLVTQSSLDLMGALKQHPEILAIKGCGALGADVLLIITLKKYLGQLKSKLLHRHPQQIRPNSFIASSSHMTLTTHEALVDLQFS